MPRSPSRSLHLVLVGIAAMLCFAQSVFAPAAARDDRSGLRNESVGQVLATTSPDQQATPARPPDVRGVALLVLPVLLVLGSALRAIRIGALLDRTEFRIRPAPRGGSTLRAPPLSILP